MVVVLDYKKASIYTDLFVACWYLLCHFLDCSERNNSLCFCVFLVFPFIGFHHFGLVLILCMEVSFVAAA